MSRLSSISTMGRSLLKKQRPNRKFRNLRVEQLESRQMLASQILGTVWNDANGDGNQQAGESGLQGWEVFLDSNNNGTHDEHVQTVNSTGPAVPITDLTTITSTLNVSGLASPIVDVNVGLTINHTFDGDLDVFLISPTGTRVELFTDVGGSGDGFANTTIDDQATISIASANAPFAGSFKPEGVLSAFNGEDANGDWTLEIFDDANQDVGQLVSWSFTIRGAGEPMTTTDINGDYAFSQLDAGDYIVRQVLQADWNQTFPGANAAQSVTLTQDQVLQNIDFGNKSDLGEIQGTVWNDVNGDGVRQAGELELPGWSVYLDLNNNGSADPESQTVISSDVPVAFADLTTVTSQIDVSGFATAIADIDLTLSLTHTFDADLDIFLISPTGTRVELMTDVGGGGDNFTNTILDDEAVSGIASAAAPFSGRFRPEGSLSDFDGEIANGTWILEITDDANVDTGQLLSWSLQIAGEGEPQLLTDATGQYAFVGLAPGNYKVRQIPPSEWSQTYPAVPGAQSVTITPGEVVQGVNFGNQSILGQISGKLWNDVDGDGVPDAGEAALVGRTVFLDANDNGTRDTEFLSISSSNVPVPTVDLTTVTSQINVSGFGSLLADVDVTLSIAHTFDADLDVFLVSPNQTRVELFTDIGGSSDGVTDTTLDDEAPNSITAGSFPFTGSFRPEGSLALFDGEDPNGIWTLEITDDANKDSGQLTSWSLNLTGVGETAVVTDANGEYTFADLMPGNYKIRQELPPDWIQTAPSPGGAHAVSLASSQVVQNVDFGSSNNVALTVEDVTAIEGVGLQFAVTLNKAVQGGTTVSVTLGDDTATGGAALVTPVDYNNVVADLVFAGTAGETRTFTVATLDDAVLETSETFSVSLSSSNPLVRATDTAVGTITDNDNAALTIEDATAIEGVGVQFTVTLNKAVQGGTTVSVMLSNDTATGGAAPLVTPVDFDNVVANLVFAGTAGETKTFTVATLDDALLEPSETFNVSLSSSNALVTASDTAIGTITDNDNAALIIEDTTAIEGVGLQFTVTLDKAVQGGTTVSVTLSDDTATGGAAPLITPEDFDNVVANLVFAGTAGETKTFTVATLDDALLEPSEAFNVSLSSSNTLVTATDTAIGTITDNDNAALTIEDATAIEGVGVQFTVTLDKAVQGGTTVSVTLNDGTAAGGAAPLVAPEDFDNVVTNLVFAGAAGETKTFTVATLGDLVLETSESFNVSLSSSNTLVTATDTAIGTITDNDNAALTIEDATAIEGVGVLFTVTLDKAVQGGTTVTVTLSNDTATGGAAPLVTPEDFDNVVTDLVFAGTAGETKSFIVATLDDAVLETSETFNVSLSSSNTLVTTTDTAIGTITDNDGPALTIEDATAIEGVGVLFTVTLDKAVQGGTTVGVTLSDNTASGGAAPLISPVDFDNVVADLVFAGTAGETKTFTVATLDDAILEASETFNVSLSSSNTLVTATDTAIGTITDNDTATLTIEDATAIEGVGVQFTVTLDKAVQGGTTVSVTLSDDTATGGAAPLVAPLDFDSVVANLVFSGTAGETKTFTVATLDDAVLETSETFNVSLSSSNILVAATDTAVGTITDNDNAELTIEDATAIEGVGVQFTVTLGNAVQGGTTVSVTLSDDSATGGEAPLVTPEDFDKVVADLVFAGTAGETKTFTVATLDDAVLETSETFNVSLSSSNILVTATDTAIGTITDNDAAALTIEDATAIEGVGVQFTVTLDKAVQGGTTVSVTLSDDTATGGAAPLVAPEDFDNVVANLVFAGTAGETKTFTVATLDDAVLEPSETFNVSLSSSNTLVTATDTAIGTITDNDNAALTIEDATAIEGVGMQFTVTLDKAVQGGISVSATLSDGTATGGAAPLVAPEDFDNVVANLVFTGTAGETKTFTVATLDDAVLETSETFNVSLSSSNILVTASDTAVGTITDNDNAVLTIEDATAIEGVGVQFTVTLDKAVQGGTNVSVTLGDNTATGGAALVTPVDYNNVVANLVFAGTAGETKTFTVATLDDAVLENSETFNVSLSSSNTLVTATDTAIGTITDNDAATLTIEDATAIEGVGLQFTVTLDKAVQGGTTVSVTLGDDTATGGAAPLVTPEDFNNVVTNLVFAGTAGETKTFTVATLDDAVLETSETFNVSLNSSNTLVTATDTAIGTINDNEAASGTISGLLWEDLNGNGVQDTGESALAGRTVFLDENGDGVQNPALLSVDSTDLPKQLLDFTTVTSQISVTGLTSPVTDVNVTVSMNHQLDRDLDVFLISPTGTRVELFTDVNQGGGNFVNTTLDDEAATLITSASPPYTGSFRPEGLLADFDGEIGNGIWILEVTDDGAGDTGQLLSWSLGFATTGEPTALTDATGHYEFVDLSAGNYNLRQVLPEGWTQTLPVAGAGQVVDLVSSPSATNVNFGSRLTNASIRGTVWRDDNADGIRQGGEVGIADWFVYLDANGNGAHDPASVSVASTDVPKPITDFTTVTSQINIAGLTSQVADVNITLSINHQLDRDLDVFLVSPTGTRVELFTDVDRGGGNFVNTTLDDEATTSIVSAPPPFTGTFRPEGLLSAFDGEIGNGLWTLEVTDDGTGDTGQLLSWSLEITAEGEPVAVTDANGLYLFENLTPGQYLIRQILPTDWAQIVPQGGGGQSVTLAEGQQAVGLDFGNQFQQVEIRGTAWNDVNADGIRDTGENGLGNRQIYIDANNNGQLDQELVAVSSGHIDMPIPDQSTVTSDVVVSGFSSPITDVNVALTITHTYDADLDVFIISPSGTRVELFTDVGGGGDGFVDTIFDDQTDFPITTGLPPFVWSFQPEGSLADFNGEDANGTWTLEITDDAANDVGELHDWSIQITGASEPTLFTESDGSYAFSSLAPGNYTIRQIVPPLWEETVPAGGSYAVQVHSGSLVQGLDFASYNTQPAYQLLPDLTVLADQSKGYLYDALLETSGGQTLIRFTTATANIGEGVAQLIGGDANPDGTQDVLQRIYDTDGLFTDRVAGQFIFHPEHNHIHFEGYGQYNLRAVTTGEGVGDVLATADKVSFCLLDSAPHDLSIPGAPSSAQFTSCGAVSQGISVGWADVYHNYLPDQTIDITGLPSGTYWLEIVVDPDNSILELDETNNTTRILVDVNVEAGTVTPLNLPQLLQAAGGEGSGEANVVPLDTASLEPLLTEAIARFAAAGASELQLNTLASINFQIADLPDAQLGRAFGSTIQLDIDGAGYGWFVDSTSADDAEFVTVSSTKLRADDDSAASGSMDVMTVILHEFGHILDLDHDSEDDLMGESLETGTRHLLALDLFFSELGEP